MGEPHTPAAPPDRDPVELTHQPNEPTSHVQDHRPSRARRHLLRSHHGSRQRRRDLRRRYRAERQRCHRLPL